MDFYLKMERSYINIHWDMFFHDGRKLKEIISNGFSFLAEVEVKLFC